ncbi:DUF4198 domain-containing protein [Litoreibacter janthinus]|uniref:Uncharacterized conserved protein, contains GH25 family domain n=1 Tax=Litoreibacter janthinus TaxID=670154 RepID=A0A1I6FY17_9RHOB|nr:DUF4198 domain-containing protein [Litoreibacter janthinus]SFR34828.1 Uncharacterized conserved protein, contains GH25 family domain [Litoreibacter janthinus]
MSSLRLFRTVALFLWAATSAQAHEFWISPEVYETPKGGEIQAHLRVGQEFGGASYSFNPNQFERFDLVAGDQVIPVTGRLGDTPALGMTSPADGLITIVHETGDNILTYKEMEKFEKFAKHKDFEWAVTRHMERGLPTDRFMERYRRYAKSLVAVGDGAGADREVGLKTEIVALANPYTDTVDQFPVKVLMDGKPRVNAQIELFDKAPDGEVTITLYRTDADGIGTFPVSRGHEYLVDAVALLPLEEGDATKYPVWSSIWASLTFKVPE